jgi:uncharacterized phage protein (TIGR02220 family)
MKRFTETTKWDNKWFRRLEPRLKLLWQYLVDKCDAAGVIEIDEEVASLQIGETVSESDLDAFGDKMKRLPSGKYLLVKFIAFQYGKLSRDCKAHWHIFKLLEVHGLELDTLSIPYAKGMATLPAIPSNHSDTLKDKDKDKDKDALGESEGEYHKDSRTVLHLLNEAAGRHYRETDSNLKFISARLSEPGVDLDGMRQMISRQCKKWNGTNMADYLRPETLFNKTKFDGYYAARQEPINENSSITHAQSPDRNAGTANAGKASQYAGLGKVVAT